MEAILDEFDSYLELQCLRSVHTRRAYLGDLRSLFAFLGERAPDTGLQGLSLPILRSWLAAGAGAGAARTTLARRTSAVKTFTAWAMRRGLLTGDPAARLAGAQGAPGAAGGVAAGPGARRDDGCQIRLAAR